MLIFIGLTVAAILLYLVIGLLTARLYVKYEVQLNNKNAHYATSDYGFVVIFWPFVALIAPFVLLGDLVAHLGGNMVVNYAKECEKKKYAPKDLPEAKIVK